jgi:hypothetical protein
MVFVAKVKSRRWIVCNLETLVSNCPAMAVVMDYSSEEEMILVLVYDDSEVLLWLVVQ